MAYISTADLKVYLGLTISDDDTLLTSLITSAQAIIDAYTNTTFDVSTATDRFFTFDVDTEDRILYFDEWLAASPTTVVNGDGITISASDYVLLSPQRAPYYALQLKLFANVFWTFSTSPENSIKVNGKWGWSTTPPADVIQATRRLVAYLYRAKDAQTFDQTAFTELGIIKIKAQIPNDVCQILDRYARLVGR